MAGLRVSEPKPRKGTLVRTVKRGRDFIGEIRDLDEGRTFLLAKRMNEFNTPRNAWLFDKGLTGIFGLFQVRHVAVMVTLRPDRKIDKAEWIEELWTMSVENFRTHQRLENSHSPIGYGAAQWAIPADAFMVVKYDVPEDILLKSLSLSMR